MSMKHAICLIVLCAISFKSFSQSDSLPRSNRNQLQPAPKEFERFIDRIYYGGNVGAWFGQTTYVNLQPLIAVKISKKFSLGGGFTYNYYSINNVVPKYSTSIYGSNAFARYLVLDNLMLQVGWDRLNVPDYYSYNLDRRAWVDNILVGGGYRQQFSEYGSIIALVFYNINESPLSPYQNPIIQIGFNLGF